LFQRALEELALPGLDRDDGNFEDHRSNLSNIHHGGTEDTENSRSRGAWSVGVDLAILDAVS
jgi:hypothetical protein